MSLIEQALSTFDWVIGGLISIFIVGGLVGLLARGWSEVYKGIQWFKAKVE